MNAPQDILDTLEKIDDDFDEKEVEVVKCSDPDFAKEEFGLGGQLPFLAMFENEVREDVLIIIRHLMMELISIIM